MYYVYFLLAYLLSLLPMWLLYGLSDFAYILLFKLLAYRKKVVWSNLTYAFPEKSEEVRRQIMKRFYHSFCDQWVETLKLMSASQKYIKKRFSGNWTVFEQAVESGNGRVVVLLGHQFNWEWGNLTMPLCFSGRYAGIYLPLKSKAVDKLMLYIRRRTGALLIPAQDMRWGFKELANHKHILAFIADQTPASLKIADWHLFMNRQAPFLNGPEKVARIRQAAVVFVGLRKLKRGHYELFAEQICTNARNLPEGEVIKRYVDFLQNELRQQPANWMWSHRRWKKTPPAKL